MDTCPSPSFGCSEGHRGANRYFIIITVLALLILIFPKLTLPPKRFEMSKKRRKDDSCTSTSPTIWSLPLARPRAGYTHSQPQHQGNAKGVKKQVWLNQTFIVLRVAFAVLGHLSFFPWKGPKHEKFMVGIFKQIRPVWLGKFINLAKNFKKLMVGALYFYFHRGFFF